jgi:hypothetical protein
MLKESIVKVASTSSCNGNLADTRQSFRERQSAWVLNHYMGIVNGKDSADTHISEDEIALLQRLTHANVAREDCDSEEDYNRKVANIENARIAYYCMRNTGMYRTDKLYIFESCLHTLSAMGTTIYTPLNQSRLRARASVLQYSSYQYRDYYTNLSLEKCESMLRSKFFALYVVGSYPLGQVADCIDKERPLALENIKPIVEGNSTFNKDATYKGVAWGINLDSSASDIERNLGKLAYLAIERTALSYALGILNLTGYKQTLATLDGIIRKLHFKITPDSTVGALVLAAKSKDCRASACTIYNMLHELCVRGTKDLLGVVDALGSDSLRANEKISLESSSTFYANGYYDMPEHINVLYKQIFLK